MVTATPETVLRLVDAAKSAGANGIVFGDTKLGTWWFRYPGAKWESNVKEVISGIRALGLAYIMQSQGLGYCQSPVAFDQNLAAGYPMRNVRLKVLKSGALKPEENVKIPNVSFESSDGNSAGWGFQDLVGVATFIDSKVAHTGKKSLRFDIDPSRSTRVFLKVPARSFHQYTLSVWVKAKDVTTNNFHILIRDGNDKGRALTRQAMSLPTDSGGRQYFTSGQDLSFDWSEMRLSFNSLSTTSIEVILGVWGGEGGSVWWDDLKILSTPTLNLLRRASLPFSLTIVQGRKLKEGRNFKRVRDGKLGQTLFGGNYDTYHDGPVIRMKRSAKISTGDIVLLNGYHTIVTASGQVGCSWSDRGVLSVMRKTYQNIERMFPPDAYFLGHDEIRTGGWEPKEIAQGSSGKAFAKYLRYEINMIRRLTKNKKYLYVWNDMVDPFHNAVDKYYHTYGSFSGSWKGLSPSKIAIVNWVGNSEDRDGRASFEFFEKLGYTQIASGFYDFDVTKNRQGWETVVRSSPIGGSMYTTWVSGPFPFPGNFDELEAFGKQWW